MQSLPNAAEVDEIEAAMYSEVLENYHEQQRAKQRSQDIWKQRESSQFKSFVRLYARNEAQRKQKMEHERPYTLQMSNEIRTRALSKTDAGKAGNVYPSDAGVPPGHNYLHVGLKYLDLKR